MDCHEAREFSGDNLARPATAEQAADLQRHLSGCSACRAHVAADRVLSEVIEAKMPRYAAPLALKRRLAANWPAPAPAARRAGRKVRAFALAGALAAVLAVVIGGTSVVVEHRSELRQLESETVNDHLRVLQGAPLAQVTGGLHEVKPWFGGKLDFAPSVRFAGSPEFPLQGGAVEPFLDRRAAVFVYKRRLHTASLFVVNAEGLAFPLRPRAQTVRGFSLILWKVGDQGYALVSDLGLSELLELQRQIASS